MNLRVFGPSFGALTDNVPEVLAGPGPGHVLAPHQLQVGLGPGAGAARARRLRHEVPKQSQIRVCLLSILPLETTLLS